MLVILMESLVAEGAPAVATPQLAVPRICPTCGSSMAKEAIWCVACKLYQPDGADSKRTSRCEHCGNYFPIGARICCNCKEPIQNSWCASWSVAALSAITALASSFVAFLLTLGQVFNHHFPTPAALTVRLIDVNPPEAQLTVDVLNDGDRTAVVDKFRVHVVVTDKSNREAPWEFDEPLASSDGERSFFAKGSDSGPMKIKLHPTSAAAAGRWNLEESLTSTNQLHGQLAEIEIKHFGEAVKLDGGGCTLQYVTGAAAKQKTEPVTVATLDMCSEFLKSAYGLEPQ